MDVDTLVEVLKELTLRIDELEDRLALAEEEIDDLVEEMELVS